MEKDEFIKALGNQVRRTRLAKDMSLYRLAKNINKTPSSIQRLEKGAMNPSYFFLLEIATGLDVSISELTKGLK